MHVDLDCAFERVAAGAVDVRAAPAAIPVVGGRVFVCDGHEGNFRVVRDGVDAQTGFGVVLRCVGLECFDQTLALW